MRRRRLLWVLLVLLPIGWYAVRAVQGWIGGAAYARGRLLAGYGRYEQALPLLDRAAVGSNRPLARWLAGQVRVGLWQQAAARGDSGDALDRLYDSAHEDYTAALSMSPALGWYRVNLGDLYNQRERLERHLHGVPLEALAQGRWALVGRAGRVAVGLTRLGIRQEPTWYAFHDQLAYIFLEYGLDEEMLAAVSASAAVQPIYRMHAYTNLNPPPPELLESFAEGSRAALDETPLLRRVLHLLALGRVEWRRGRCDLAVIDLEASRALPGEGINRAEASYYLGLCALEDADLTRAEELLLAAGEHPNFAALSLVALARVAEARGDPRRALDLLLQARRLDPRRLAYAIRYSRVARGLGEHEKAEQALRWAITVDPRSLPARRNLISDFIEDGKLRQAEREIDELGRIPGSESEVAALRRKLEALQRD